uniref:Uncharacterized protein n=1 Tax=Candidatus Kentrum sp. FW TaxID=2126338 RepID=A0A450TZJ4_9GAMM|nr:MAG: hypothetical protein BECKFW1821C_GA0114237_10784 [Candidatus Kentron sp. FW]
MVDKDIVSKGIIGQLAAYLAIYLLDLPIDPDFQEAMGTDKTLPLFLWVLSSWMTVPSVTVYLDIRHGFGSGYLFGLP